MAAKKETAGQTKEPEAVLEETATSRPIIVRLSHTTHRALRIRVAEEDTTIQKWVEQLIREELVSGKR